jgi:hypothetical protein
MLLIVIIDETNGKYCEELSEKMRISNLDTAVRQMLPQNKPIEYNSNKNHE